MNVLIIEDEERNFNHLKRLLDVLVPQCNILGPIISVANAINYLERQEVPDLILADIRLSDGLIFDVLEQVFTRTPIIFTTAYDEYALRAFKYNSLDYLLKPITLENLDTAINKIHQRKMLSLDMNIQQIVMLMKQNNYQYRERFLLQQNDGYKIVWTKDINHIATENGIVRIFLNDGTSHIISMSMEKIENQLNPNIFFRANRQYIICLESICDIRHSFNSKINVYLRSYSRLQIVVSRDRVSLLKQWIDGCFLYEKE